MRTIPQFVAAILHFQVVGHHRVQGTSVLEGRCRAIRHLQLTQRLPEATKAIQRLVHEWEEQQSMAVGQELGSLASEQEQ
jgi:hypothetical protein